MVYDCIIIGRGLIGSAAAKYISDSAKKVALVGPDEETVLQQQIVFASHYDRARIQRIFGRDEVSTLLNQQSANAYSSIENETGIHFHSQEGCLYVNPYGIDSYLENVVEQSKKFRVNFQSFNSGESLNSFAADYHFPSSSKGIFEAAPSGHINPRLLIKAQLDLFKKNRGEIFNDTVTDVSNKNNEIKITTLSGKSFYSKKVLLAPGAFVNFFDLLPGKLFLTLKSESTVWVKTPAEEGLRLSKLPALLYKIKEPEIDDIYLIRPLQYPDGNFYLKMGANFPGDIFFKTLNEVQNWFKSGNNEGNLKIMNDYLHQLIPSISTENFFTKKCIVCYTKHGKPYIGEVQNNLFVAAGGNGYSAMSSDALGRIAASVVLRGEFPRPFSSKSFVPVFL
jgi:glycine/D-amino acid oxidase-like deaminating enzyme